MNPRLILAALLLATPLLCAQETPAKAETKPSPEPFRITVNLKTTEKGKITGQRSYVLAGTADRNIHQPQIRDHSRVPVITGGDPANYEACRKQEPGCQFQWTDIGTAIDLLDVKKADNLLYLTLRISTDDLESGATMVNNGLPPVIRSRNLTVTPTLAIGKLTTVYSSVDAANDIKVEIQVLVQPLNDN